MKKYMNTVIIADGYDDLADIMYNIACEGFTACAALDFEKARKLAKSLLIYDDVVISDLFELYSANWNGYSKEFYVTLSEGSFELGVEPAWHEKNEYHDACYFTCTDGILLIEKSADHEIANRADEDTIIYDFEVDGEDYDCDTCEHRDECDQDNEDLADLLEYIMDKFFKN